MKPNSFKLFFCLLLVTFFMIKCATLKFVSRFVPILEIIDCIGNTECPEGYTTQFVEVEEEEGDWGEEVSVYRCRCVKEGSAPQQTLFHPAPRLKRKTNVSFNPDYFPLDFENTWTFNVYEDTVSQTTFRITEQTVLNDVLYHTISVTIPDSTGAIALTPAFFLYNDTLEPNDIYFILDSTGSTKFFQHTYPDSAFMQNGSMAFATHVGQVTVPAGTFESCIYFTDSITVGVTFAPDVGPIRFDSAGVLTMELTSFSVKQKCALAATFLTTPNSCHGASSGAIQLKVQNGSDSMTYTWTGPIAIGNIQNPTGLPAGNYSVAIKDMGGCSLELTDIAITQPDEMSINKISINDPLCTGDRNGKIDITVSGGTGSYTYAWNISGQQTVEDPGNLPAGTYHLMVSDSNNCFLSDSFTLVDPDPILISLTHTNESAFMANDGSVMATVIGGTANYEYLWSNGETTQSIDSLSASTYSVTVSDQNNCSDVNSTLVQAFNCTLAASLSSTDISCFGSDNGNATLTILGANNPIDILWSNGTKEMAIDSLKKGNYSVTVSDMTNCSQVQDFTILEPEQLVVSIDTIGSDDGLNNGFILIDVLGGTPPYIYSWNMDTALITTSEDPENLKAGNYQLNVIDANGCQATIDSVTVALQCALIAESEITNITCNGDSSGVIKINVLNGSDQINFSWKGPLEIDNIQNPTGLPTGNYSVTIDDISGCMVEINDITINQPEKISIAKESISDPLCFGDVNGSIDISVSGGSGSYSYDWNNPGLQMVEDPENLPAGTYHLMVRDSNNCSTLDSFTLMEPDPISILLTHTNETAALSGDGSATATVDGGTGNYIYIWSNGKTTPSIDSLSSGTYSVTVSDQNYCTQTMSTLIQAFNCTLAASLISSDISCNGINDGNASLTIVGANDPIDILWSNGQKDMVIDSLENGHYMVTVSDMTNCSQTLSFSILKPDTLTVTIDTIGADNGFGNGLIAINVQGGTPPYNYEWKMGTIPITTTEDPENLKTGSYQLELTDMHGCQVTIDSIVVDLSTSNDHLSLDHLMHIYPNPTTGILKFRSPIDKNFMLSDRVRLINMLGQKVLTTSWINNQIDLSNIPSGMYFMQIAVGNRMLSKRILIYR